MKGMKATATTTRATMDPPTTFNLTMATAANGMAAIRFGEEAEEVLADAAGEEEVETEVADGTIADAFYLCECEWKRKKMKKKKEEWKMKMKN